MTGVFSVALKSMKWFKWNAFREKAWGVAEEYWTHWLGSPKTHSPMSPDLDKVNAATGRTEHREALPVLQNTAFTAQFSCHLLGSWDVRHHHHQISNLLPLSKRNSRLHKISERTKAKRKRIELKSDSQSLGFFRTRSDRSRTWMNTRQWSRIICISLVSGLCWGHARMNLLLRCHTHVHAVQVEVKEKTAKKEKGDQARRAQQHEIKHDLIHGLPLTLAFDWRHGVELTSLTLLWGTCVHQQKDTIILLITMLRTIQRQHSARATLRTE